MNWIAWAALSAGSVCGVAAIGCAAPEDERVSCDDVLPPDEATFSDLKALMQRTDGKGCANESCHGAAHDAHGYRFDRDSAMYDALSTRFGAVYGVVAGETMPPTEERPNLATWNQADLQLLASWYCNGAFFE